MAISKNRNTMKEIRIEPIKAEDIIDPQFKSKINNLKDKIQDLNDHFKSAGKSAKEAIEAYDELHKLLNKSSN